MMDFFRDIFKSDTFMPHGHCYLWQPEVLWLHVISDAIIALAYASIPFALIYLVRKRKDLAFNWVFVMFGTFILACGTTHFISIWTVWDPIYRLDGVVKAITALSSIATAVALWPLIPRILSLPSAQQLQDTNEELKREISERIKTEKQLEEKNAALVKAEHLKSEFIANVSHELRTPLTLIMAPLESMLTSPPSAHQQEHTLRTVYNNSLKLLQMVSGVLDFAKIDAHKFTLSREPIDIVNLTQSIINDFSGLLSSRNIFAAFSTNVSSPVVMIDRYVFERILFNLVSNAIKFTASGGKITVLLQQQAEQLILSVTDTGIGISASDQKEIFQRFKQLEGSSTRRFEGTGLGLALVKEFCELLGGTVRVDSVQGEGSTFTAVLTAPTAKNSEAKLPTSPASPLRIVPITTKRSTEPLTEPKIHCSGPLAKILIAEDNIEMAHYIGSLLTDIADIQMTRDGHEALAAVKEWRPDILLSDIMMPGLDGVSLCKHIKNDAELSGTTVVLLTALTHREAMLQGWEAGADEYLFKPFHPSELLTRVKTLIAARTLRHTAEAQNLELAKEQAVRENAEKTIKKLTQIEAELRRTNRVKDEFLAVVSHELRTPMNAILGWAELLRNQQVETQEYQETFEILYRNAKAQAKLTEDLLDISRIISGKLKLNVEAVRLGPLIEETVESMRLAAEAKRIKLRTDVNLDAPPIAGDPDRLRQVIWNLLSNAVKFSFADSVIDIHLRHIKSKLEFEILDRGQGIETEFLPFVFERFLQEDSSDTRRFGGLGLGLSIVRHIVELHGGMCSAYSAGKNTGACFKIQLPILAVRDVTHEDATKKNQGVTDNDPLLLKGLHILVVDDDPDARHLASRILSRYGASVNEAASAKEAFEKVQAHQHDVLVSDICMPEEDGCLLLEKIRNLEGATGKHLPAAALTAHSGAEIGKQIARAGFEVFLAKPVPPREFVRAVARLAGRSSRFESVSVD